MSSSDESLGWHLFADREAAEPVSMLSPADELTALLRRYQGDLDQTRASAAAEVADIHRLGARQAVLVAQLEQVLGETEAQFEEAGLKMPHRRLRILKDQLRDSLNEAGFTFEIPTGRPFADVADAVEVVHWRQGPEFTEEVVAGTHEPIVLYRGLVIRHGQVIMGAPPEPETR